MLEECVVCGRQQEAIVCIKPLLIIEETPRDNVRRSKNTLNLECGRPMRKGYLASWVIDSRRIAAR